MLKSEAIKQAYAMIRISGLTTDEIPEEVNIALLELDQMMWSWQAMGRDVDYNFPLATDDNQLVQSDPNEQLGVASWALRGVIACLAKSVVEYFGKEIPTPIMLKASTGINTIMLMTVKLDNVQYPNRMPIGSGNRRYNGNVGNRFYHPRYGGRALTENIVQGDTFNATADFTEDLINNNTPITDAIASYTATATGGIKIEEETLDGTLIHIKLRGEPDDSVLDRTGNLAVVVQTTEGATISKSYCYTISGNTCRVTQSA